MQKYGGWVFISHSHLDIEIVRKIRNKLESSGYEPLMFYLKCLNDDDEIESLIKREIDERDWFIFVDSENAANSKWVKTEREYIYSLEGKKWFTVNVDGDIDFQIESIIKHLKVFISYSYKDRNIFNMIKDKLIEHDFLVFDDGLIDEDWNKKIADGIKDVSKNGFFISLISKNSIKNHEVKDEIVYAKRCGATIIPVIVGDVEISNFYYLILSTLQTLKIDSEPSEEQLNGIVNYIMRNIDYKGR